MKYVVIAALFALLLLLLYSRVYPYIQLLKKIFGAARTIGDSPNSRDAFRGVSGTPDRKLVRCVSCGTWIPGERAIGTRAGSSVYCSRECLEKPTATDKRKAVS